MSTSTYNPFTSRMALVNSYYCAIENGELVRQKHIDQRADTFALRLYEQLKTQHNIKQVNLTQINEQTIKVKPQPYIKRIGMYNLMGSAGATAGLSRDLMHYINDYYGISTTKDAPTSSTQKSSFIALFENPTTFTDSTFKQLTQHQLFLLKQQSNTYFNETNTAEKEILNTDNNIFIFADKYWAVEANLFAKNDEQMAVLSFLPLQSLKA